MPVIRTFRASEINMSCHFRFRSWPENACQLTREFSSPILGHAPYPVSESSLRCLKIQTLGDAAAIAGVRWR